MKTISLKTESSLRELGSKFFGFLFYCENEQTFKDHLDRIKAAFPDASHHCYGYRINPNSVVEFSSDDGEPSGTAGLPILNQLKSFDVVNAGIVVVRYFGGTKLGKSGLIASYGESARLCLEKASFQTIKSVHLFRVSYPYSEENRITKIKLNYGLTEQSSEYLEHVTLTLACFIEKSKALEQELEDLAYLGILFEKFEQTFIAV